LNDRLITGRPLDDDLGFEVSLRPRRLDEYVGQAPVIANLRVAIEAARARGEALDHVLLFGPPGVGKTSLAHVIAAELQVPIKATAGPIIERAGDLAALLTALEPREILFVDEIHRLDAKVEEILYPALEDQSLDLMIGSGPGARSMKIPLKPFTLVAATTRAGLLTAPLRGRFGIVHRLDFYTEDDLAFRRRTHSRPIVDRLHQVIVNLHGRVVPKSPLGKGITYAINQWSTLVVFLDDPRVPLSNVHVERQQRRTALGRKNYLFTGSDEGGRRLAILQTLIVACDLVDAPVFEYLRDVFGKIAAGWPHSRIAELLPAAWLANQRRQQPDSDAIPAVDPRP
jgi:hypothetical protein